jgi:hypothetical protein
MLALVDSLYVSTLNPSQAETVRLLRVGLSELADQVLIMKESQV